MKRNAEPRPDLAFDPDVAAHQLDQPRRDRQAEAGAAEAAGRRAVRLRERLEDQLLLVARDADAGVDDREVQADLAGQLRRDVDAQPDLPAVGELDRVADQVDEHLPQPQRVADERVGHFRRHVEVQARAPSLRRVTCTRVEHVLQRLRGARAARAIEGQLARVDLREVEDVADDGEERFGRRA